MLLALVLQAAAPQTAVDAERAFNAAAQAKGQWTAFREFAAPDAIIFTPQPEKAETALPTKNPPVSVQWSPGASYVSCDGKAAVNTGPWVRPGSKGYFTTVWLKQPDGAWKWALDHGDALPEARPQPTEPEVRRASCDGVAETIPATFPNDSIHSQGSSPDRTLSWSWVVWPNGKRMFVTELWDGQGYELVIEDIVAAPAK